MRRSAGVVSEALPGVAYVSSNPTVEIFRSE